MHHVRDGECSVKERVRGLLGSRRELFPHQCSGDVGSLLCPKGIHEGPEESINRNLIRQPECGSPYKQDGGGGYKITGFDHSDENMVMAFREKVAAIGSARSRQVKSDGRLPIKISQRQD